MLFNVFKRKQEEEYKRNLLLAALGGLGVAGLGYALYNNFANDPLKATPNPAQNPLIDRLQSNLQRLNTTHQELKQTTGQLQRHQLKKIGQFGNTQLGQLTNQLQQHKLITI